MSSETLPLEDIKIEENIAPQWNHPFLSISSCLSKKELESLAYDYFLRFLHLFREDSLGGLRTGIQIKFTRRMKNQLGSASVYTGDIRLNQDYFSENPALLPYTLFHELTHLWLYDCYYDPGHTKRFYNKMKQFDSTGLPCDPNVHIHKRIQSEGRYVYKCTSCEGRWFHSKRYIRPFYCGVCHEKNGQKNLMKMFRNGETFRTSQLGVCS